MAACDQLMWPWEHLAVGYVAYSLLVRIWSDRGPSAVGAVAVALGTQFPDLIDKPLGWGTTLLPSGQSLGHSLLFAVPVIVLVLTVASQSDHVQAGTAFAVGYLSHLPGDVIYPVILGGDLNLSFLFWPVLAASGSQPVSILSYVGELFAQFAAVLMTPEGVFYLGFEVALVFGAFALWIVDGAPGLPRPSTAVGG